MHSLHLKVHGLVQGVFFRKHTREKAMSLSISGTVRNCEDSSVEIYAEGAERALNEFTEWCRVGPEGARVDRLDINETPLKNYSGFRIIY
jgi:acylphosphatase